MPAAPAFLSLSAFLLAVAGFALSNCAYAQDSPGPIVTVIHIDVMPPNAQDAATLLARFRQDSLHDPGEKGFQVLREIGRPNHFTLVEAWSDRKTYDGHNAAAHTRQFRDQIQPMLGSPFDERLHTELPAAP